MTSYDLRADTINGLLDLAAFLEAHPELPVPTGIQAMVFSDDAPDEEMRSYVDQIAAVLATQTEPLRSTHGDHYRAVLFFGPVEYSAVAILSAARARHEADKSYFGCIDPA